MAAIIIYIPNNDNKITPSVGNPYWLKRFDTQLNEPTNLNSIKVPKIVKPRNKKT